MLKPYRTRLHAQLSQFEWRQCERLPIKFSPNRAIGRHWQYPITVQIGRARRPAFFFACYLLAIQAAAWRSSTNRGTSLSPSTTTGLNLNSPLSELDGLPHYRSIVVLPADTSYRFFGQVIRTTLPIQARWCCSFWASPQHSYSPEMIHRRLPTLLLHR